MNHKKRISGFLAIGTLGACLCLVGIGIQLTDNDAVSCQNQTLLNSNVQQINGPQCSQSKPANSISWTSWLFGTGNSRQFHYLDLLELLSRHSDNQKDATPQP